MAVKYEYKCPKCGEVTELTNSDTDNFCGGYIDDSGDFSHEPEQMKRVYSLGGIAFKGSGFYKNDK
jgi:predicted nucleic acid-binding Zn ribbon protein